MKYWTISFPGDHGQHVVETWSEPQILSSYMPYWISKMNEVGKQNEISSDRCIEDWTVIHWALQTDEWGNSL
jgi:hypothetical protein